MQEHPCSFWLVKGVGIGFFVEANENMLTHNGYGRPQVARAAQHGIQGFIGRFLTAAEFSDFLPFATTMVFALANSAAASSRCSLRLAGMVSLISI